MASGGLAGPQPVPVNKVLLAHGHTRLLTRRLRLLPRSEGAAEL